MPTLSTLKEFPVTPTAEDEATPPFRIVLLHDDSPALTAADRLCGRLCGSLGEDSFDVSRQDIATVEFPYVLEDFLERTDHADMLICALTDEEQHHESLHTCLDGLMPVSAPDDKALVLVLCQTDPGPVSAAGLWESIARLCEEKGLDFFARSCSPTGEDGDGGWMEAVLVNPFPTDGSRLAVAG